MALEIVLNMVCSFVGVMLFGALFNVPRKYYLGSGLTGLVGWMGYYFAAFRFSTAFSAFISAALIAMMGRILAVKMKAPITIFVIPGLFPLVPGISIYQSVYNLVIEESEKAAKYGLDAFKVALGIALGIIFVLNLPGKWFTLHNKKKGGR